jgi:hypothetical protein
MHTHEIARQDWRTALDELSHSHDGDFVSVEIDSPTIGTHSEVLELPLAGISIEGHDPGQAIAIAMGKGADTHITHLIDKPIRLFVERDEAQANAALEVESADHTRTILRFGRRSI